MKLKVLLLTVLMCVFFGTCSAFADDVTVLVDGRELEFDTSPIIENDRLLVPLRGIFEALGADVSWDASAKTVTAVTGKITLKIAVGDDVLFKNNAEIELDVSAVIKNSRTLVPLRAVSEGFGADVDWDGASRTVKIISADVNKAYAAEEPRTDELEKFMADKSARAQFEKVDLPSELKKYGADFADDIEDNPKNAKNYIFDIWNHCQTEALIKIMDESDVEYTVDSEFEAALSEVVKKCGKDAETQLEITVEDGVLFISFRETTDGEAEFAAVRSENDDVRCVYAVKNGGNIEIYEIIGENRELLKKISGDFVKSEFEKLIKEL